MSSFSFEMIDCSKSLFFVKIDISLQFVKETVSTIIRKLIDFSFCVKRRIFLSNLARVTDVTRWIYSPCKTFWFYFIRSHLKYSKHSVIFVQVVQCLSAFIRIEFLCFSSEESTYCSTFCHWTVVSLITFGFLYFCCECLKPKSNHLHVRLGSPRHHTG